MGAKGKLEHVNSDCEDNSDAENDIVKRRRGKNKVWKLYLQMNDSDPMRNCSDSVSHLKRIVLKELGSHVYHSKGNVRRESILKCNTHLDCNHFVKVGPGINGNFKIMYSGQHETVTRVPKHGIAPFVKSRVVTAGQLRVTAMNLRNNLTLDTCVPTAVVPSTRQLQNKLSYDKRKSQIPMEIIHDITSFVNTKTVNCNTEDYRNLTGDSHFVVSSHEFTSTNDAGERCNCVGFTLTTKDMIGNLQHAIEISEGTGLVLSTDGTYKLIIGNWVVIILGCTVVIFNADGTSQLSFRPILVQVTMVEQEAAYDALYKALIKIADEFLSHSDLKVACMIIDHCQASYNAVKEVLTDMNGEETSIVCCSVHLEVKVRHRSVIFFQYHPQ